VPHRAWLVSLPVLGVIGVIPDGHKHLLALDLCGGESFAAWKGCLNDLVVRGLRAPVLVIIGECWAATRRRPRLAQGFGPTVLCAQAAQSHA
jgi:Transposase, Mutator family